MPRTAIVILVLLLLVGSPAVADSSFSDVQQGRDKQIALDLEHLNFDRLLSKPNRNVAVLKLAPDADVGSLVTATILTDHVVTGVVIEGSKVSGQYEVMHPASTRSTNVSSYYQWVAHYITSFDAYTFNSNRSLPWSEHDNRFIRGGTLFCHVNSNVIGSGRFSEDSLIPDAWQKYVPGALDFHKTHPGLFASGGVKKNQTALVALLDDPNPFLAIEAERCLAENLPFDPAFVPLHLAKVDAYKQAAFTLLLLNNAPEQTRPALMSELAEVISSAPDAAAIKGIVLAASSVEDEVLLTQVNQKLNALNTHTEADDYIINLLTLAKVRK